MSIYIVLIDISFICFIETIKQTTYSKRQKQGIHRSYLMVKENTFFSGFFRASHGLDFHRFSISWPSNIPPPPLLVGVPHDRPPAEENLGELLVNNTHVFICFVLWYLVVFCKLWNFVITIIHNYTQLCLSLFFWISIYSDLKKNCFSAHDLFLEIPPPWTSSSNFSEKSWPET